MEDAVRTLRKPDRDAILEIRAGLGPEYGVVRVGDLFFLAAKGPGSSTWPARRSSGSPASSGGTTSRPGQIGRAHV